MGLGIWIQLLMDVLQELFCSHRKTTICLSNCAGANFQCALHLLWRGANLRPPNVGIYLPDNVFCHGQLYVALSYATSAENVWILVKQYSDLREGTWTHNIVYNTPKFSTYYSWRKEAVSIGFPEFLPRSATLWCARSNWRKRNMPHARSPPQSWSVNYWLHTWTVSKMFEIRGCHSTLRPKAWPFVGHAGILNVRDINRIPLENLVTGLETHVSKPREVSPVVVYYRVDGVDAKQTLDEVKAEFDTRPFFKKDGTTERIVAVYDSNGTRYITSGAGEDKWLKNSSKNPNVKIAKKIGISRTTSKPLGKRCSLPCLRCLKRPLRYKLQCTNKMEWRTRAKLPFMKNWTSVSATIHP